MTGILQTGRRDLNRCFATAVVWFLTGCASASAQTAQAEQRGAVQAAPSFYDMGQRWQVREVLASGPVFDGVWTRTGAHTFSAEWRAAGSDDVVRDAVEIERQYGNVVVLYRKANKGRYYGTISRDGRFIQGHASWYGAGDRWTAEIRSRGSDR